MRTALLSLGTVAVGLLAAAAIVHWQASEVPPVGPGVEPVCAEVMHRRPPDLSWVALDREERIRGREIEAVTLGTLLSHGGGLVRVAGVLHVEFEWVALYPSRAAMDDRSWPGASITFSSLWPDEPYWRTKAPSISDPCAVVEGTYEHGGGGYYGIFNGIIRDVVRLEVWSTPHRPFITVPPPPPAP